MLEFEKLIHELTFTPLKQLEIIMKKRLQHIIFIFLSLSLSLVYADETACGPSTVNKVILHNDKINIAKGDGIDFSLCTLEGDYISSYQVSEELSFDSKSSDPTLQTIYVDLDLNTELFELQSHGLTGAPRTSMFVHYQLPLTLLNFKKRHNEVAKKPKTEVIFRAKLLNNDKKTLLAQFPVTFNYPKTHGVNYREEGTEIPTISDITGTWYDPRFNGMGFAILEHINGTEIFFFGYAKTGEPLWLISDMTQNEWETGAQQTLTMYSSKTENGGTLNTAPKANERIMKWGTLDLSFTDCKTAKATLRGRDGVQSFDLQLLSNARNVACTKLW